MNVLISGAGIAGPCLAYWLLKHGFNPTLVERAPQPRTGGYVIDFWGAGFDVADRMGLLPEILASGYKVTELRLVDRQGRRISGAAVSAFDRLTAGRYTSLPRGDLAHSLWRALDDTVQTFFDDSVAAIEELDREVKVHFLRAPAQCFDLVIGADGLHSQVRRLSFGEDARYERYLGLKVAAFEVEGYRPRDELIYVVHREVGLQVGRFSMRDDRTVFLFVFADPEPAIPESFSGQTALLRKRFAGAGRETASILECLDRGPALYMDRVSQIRMDRWSNGRVGLVGDAAFCPSFLAGQGSALAMVAAYVLAGELKQSGGDHQAAFALYQQRLAALIAAKQAAALHFTSFFAPRSRWGMFVGDQILKLMSIPAVARFAIGREIRDRIELPQY